MGGCVLGVAAQLALWLLLSGPVALDGVLGELESPLVPLGVALALTQLTLLEGPLLLLAAWGWWRARPGRPVRAARGDRMRSPGRGWPASGPAPWPGAAPWGRRCCPLFAVHQGTFVGVARPAEPFVAVYAALALPLLAARLGRVAVPAPAGGRPWPCPCGTTCAP